MLKSAIANVLRILPEPGLVGVLCLFMAGVLVWLSGKAWALTTTLPHARTDTLDSVYRYCDPLLFLGLTTVLTFWLILYVLEFRGQLRKGEHYGIRFGIVLICSVTCLLTLVAFENLLKKGLARARPVARAEHFIIAAFIDHSLPPNLARSIRSERFECVVGRFVFKHRETSSSNSDNSHITLGNLDTETEQHLRSIRYREGIGPHTFDLGSQLAEWQQMSEWRRKRLEPFVTGLLNRRRVCDTTSSTPSGHCCPN